MEDADIMHITRLPPAAEREGNMSGSMRVGMGLFLRVEMPRGQAEHRIGFPIGKTLVIYAELDQPFADALAILGSNSKLHVEKVSLLHPGVEHLHRGATG